MEKEVFLRKYEEVYKDLYRYALFALGHPQDAEDAVSEAVMDAYKGKDGLKNPEAFRGWIFRILSRKCKAKRKEYATKKASAGTLTFSSACSVLSASVSSSGSSGNGDKDEVLFQAVNYVYHAYYNRKRRQNQGGAGGNSSP